MEFNLIKTHCVCGLLEGACKEEYWTEDHCHHGGL